MGWAKIYQTSCKFSSSKSFIRIIEFGFCPPITEMGGTPPPPQKKMYEEQII